MTIEAVISNDGMRVIERRLPREVKGLGPNQLQYMRNKGWIDRRQVIRLEKK